MLKIYPMFQDVHVMIFIGFGFLMTFLKRYGLSAISLNMLISAFSVQWTILVSGFFHLHYDHCANEETELHKRAADAGEEHLYNQDEYCNPNWPWIDINIQTLINADFAVAAVLISFGAVIGVTSPIQLLVMALIEIVLFNVNEIIGRNYIGALDAGDTIFVHMFGAYFGLAVSRVIYDDNSVTSDKAGSSRLSDLFSMIGTVFLWMYWPSFNAGAAATGDAQQRAVINTYLALCAACCSAFAVSALVNHERKFVMEHIQNATLAGGVAVGAVADMILTPFGALVMGTIAGSLSTLGYEFISPLLVKRKITDTCGVHNLHGMPAVMGGLLSVLLAAAASPRKYDQFNSGELKSLHEIFPAAALQDWSRNHQAWLQFAAMLVTMGFALVGGSFTGFILKYIGKHQMKYRPGHTIMKLALNIGNVLAPHNVPKDKFYDDDLYFAGEADEEDPQPPALKNGVLSKGK